MNDKIASVKLQKQQWIGNFQIWQQLGSIEE